jgi:hypothetical protein
MCTQSENRDGILGHQFNKSLLSLLLHAIHSPFYWQILKVYSCFNPNSLWWVHMGISLKERQITEEPMKVKIW